MIRSIRAPLRTANVGYIRCFPPSHAVDSRPCHFLKRGQLTGVDLCTRHWWPAQFRTGRSSLSRGLADRARRGQWHSSAAHRAHPPVASVRNAAAVRCPKRPDPASQRVSAAQRADQGHAGALVGCGPVLAVDPGNRLPVPPGQQPGHGARLDHPQLHTLRQQRPARPEPVRPMRSPRRRLRLSGLGRPVPGHVVAGHRCVFLDQELHRSLRSPARTSTVSRLRFNGGIKGFWRATNR